MKHIPIPQDCTNSEIVRAFDNFSNRSLWQLYFSNSYLNENDIDDDNYSLYSPKLKIRKEKIKPCHFIRNDHPIRDAFLSLSQKLNYFIENNPTTHKKCSITTTIKKIQSQFPDIIFKPTDKNLGLCAMNIHDYNTMVMEHLNNSQNYTLISNTGPATRQLFKELISNFNQFRFDTYWFTVERACINHSYNFKWPLFHCLPKLHKSGKVKGRPIAGQVEWITTPVSRILDYRLQKHLYQFPYILLNSYTLVQDLEYFNSTTFISNPDIWIITGDIESLYPNIDLPKLYNIIERIDITSKSLTEFICQNSYVSYNDQIYHQRKGIPMGTNAAVTLANIYVGTLIDEYISSRPQTLWYRRYIDDIFILWTGTKSQWLLMQNNIESLLGIPIHWDTPNKTQGIFLDITISRSLYDDTFITSTYQKPLNKYHYISPLSCHAPHMFSGFIKGELTRYSRLCSSPFNYEHIKNLFYERLIQRGYSRKYLNRIFKKHSWTYRFQENIENHSTILPFVLPYTFRSNVKQIQNIIRNSQKEITYWFDDAQVIFAHARRPNILNRLCPSSLNDAHKSILRSRNQPPPVTNNRNII